MFEVLQVSNISGRSNSRYICHIILEAQNIYWTCLNISTTLTKQ